MFDDQYGWIVGENGTILYTDDGGSGCHETFQTACTALHIYPNPVTTTLNISSPSNVPGCCSIELYDATGRFQRILYTGMINETIRIGVDKLTAGTYFLIIRADNSHVVFRFVKIVQ
jgi:hypothetical protein